VLQFDQELLDYRSHCKACSNGVLYRDETRLRLGQDDECLHSPARG